MHPNVARVAEAGAAHGITVAPRQFPESTRTAQDAADAIGCAVGQIVKSLVFLLDGQPVLALVSGSNRLDEAKLAAVLGGAVVERADADAVTAATGFSIGGIPPFGHLTPLRTAVDEDLLGYDEVWAAAGTAHDNFPIAPDDLVRASGGLTTSLKPG